jgi:hypothetical protein
MSIRALIYTRKNLIIKVNIFYYFIKLFLFTKLIILIYYTERLIK